MTNIPKLLIFEDDGMIGGMYKKWFEEAGFMVALYEDPTENPVAVVMMEQPNVILMNVIMPVMDGLAATKILKNDSRTKHIPVIGESNTFGDQEMIDNAKAVGMDDHILISTADRNEFVEKVDSWYRMTLKPKILHFEDEPFIAQMYKKKFEENGFQYVWHEHPCDPDPIEIAIKEKPDLIIMDIIMPQMDGYVATKLLKTNPQTKDIPILGFCNIGQPESMVQALRFGMNHYCINSNHVPAELVQIVRNVLSSPQTVNGCDVCYLDGVHKPCDAHGVTTVQLLDEFLKGRE